MLCHMWVNGEWIETEYNVGVTIKTVKVEIHKDGYGDDCSVMIENGDGEMVLVPWDEL